MHGLQCTPVLKMTQMFTLVLFFGNCLFLSIVRNLVRHWKHSELILLKYSVYISISAVHDIRSRFWIFKFGCKENDCFIQSLASKRWLLFNGNVSGKDKRPMFIGILPAHNWKT